MTISKTESSPESQVIPYENFNDLQIAISGESFPEPILVVCKGCYWSCTCFNIRGIINICPICHKEVSSIPLTLDEASEISYDSQLGLTIKFTRKLPLR
jgi:hypothetical protein